MARPGPERWPISPRFRECHGEPCTLRRCRKSGDSRPRRCYPLATTSGSTGSLQQRVDRRRPRCRRPAQPCQPSCLLCTVANSSTSLAKISSRLLIGIHRHPRVGAKPLLPGLRENRVSFSASVQMVGACQLKKHKRLALRESWNSPTFGGFLTRSGRTRA